MTSVPKTPKFVWPFTKVAGEFNMQETNAAAYHLLVNEGSHSDVYIALLAAVEEFFAATMIWHAQGNTETPTAEDIDTWTEGVKVEGNPQKDDYVAAILPNVALRRNLARVHAQLLESARQLKITCDDAREAFSLSLIIELNQKLTLGLIDFFDKHDVLHSFKRHSIALMSLKTYGFLEEDDIDGSGIFSISFFVLYIEACKIITSQVTTAVSYTCNLFKAPDMTMSLPAHAEATSKQVGALRNLHGLNNKEALLDHIEASKVWTYFTSAIASSHRDGDVKKVFEQANLKLLEQMQKENLPLSTAFVNPIIASVSEEITSRGLPETLKAIKPTFNKIEQVRQLLDDKVDYGKNRGRRGLVGRGLRGGGRGGGRSGRDGGGRDGGERDGGGGRTGATTPRLKPPRNSRNKIPLNEVICIICGETGHWAKTCVNVHPKFQEAQAKREAASVVNARQLVDDLRLQVNTTKRLARPTALQTVMQTVKMKVRGIGRKPMEVLLRQ